MEFEFRPAGVCTRKMNISLAPDGTIEELSFTGGCNGNTKGVAALAKGLPAEEVMLRFRGILCGRKDTSCPDQLAEALDEALEELPDYEFGHAGHGPAYQNTGGPVFHYTPHGTCSRGIDIRLSEDGVIEEVQFTGGCPGNTQGVAELCRGKTAEEVIAKLLGTRCGLRGTSCPDQLARALTMALEQQKKEKETA